MNYSAIYGISFHHREPRSRCGVLEGVVDSTFLSAQARRHLCHRLPKHPRPSFVPICTHHFHSGTIKNYSCCIQQVWNCSEVGVVEQKGTADALIKSHKTWTFIFPVVCCYFCCYQLNASFIGWQLHPFSQPVWRHSAADLSFPSLLKLKQ